MTEETQTSETNSKEARRKLLATEIEMGRQAEYLQNSEYFQELCQRFNQGLTDAILRLKPGDTAIFTQLKTGQVMLEDLRASIKNDVAVGERANKELIGDDKPKRRATT